MGRVCKSVMFNRDLEFVSSLFDQRIADYIPSHSFLLIFVNNVMKLDSRFGPI